MEFVAGDKLGTTVKIKTTKNKLGMLAVLSLLRLIIIFSEWWKGEEK